MRNPFDSRLFEFFDELQDNNNREWFADNKARYEEDVREPAVEFIAQLEKPLARSAPMLRVIPKRSGGSLMRIYRDTRFGKDKTPYKTNVGISLRHDADRDIHAPGVYVHLARDECFVGAGSWRPARETLAAIRAAIDESPTQWKKTLAAKTFRENYELAGDSLKTAPRDYSKDHPMIEHLRRIDFIGVSPLTRDQVLSDEFVKLTIKRIRDAKPLMRFLCDAIGVPY